MGNEYKIIGDDGMEYGPVDEQRMRDWAREGRVSTFTMVWRSDTARWAHAGNYMELEGYVREPPAEEPRPDAAPPAAGRPGGEAAGSGAERGHATAGYPVPGRGGAILALGLVSILSATIFSCICLGFFLAPAAGITAWILGAMDLHRIDGGMIHPRERPSTKAGMVLGIIGTFLGPLLSIAALAFSLTSLLAELFGVWL
jgi:hypothetical protein